VLLGWEIPLQYIAHREVIVVPLSEQEVMTTVLDGINRQSYMKVKAARAERKSAKGYLLDNLHGEVSSNGVPHGKTSLYKNRAVLD
jgi:hypothetical protein